jgi:hypothetical protein
MKETGKQLKPKTIREKENEKLRRANREYRRERLLAELGNRVFPPWTQDMIDALQQDRPIRIILHGLREAIEIERV